MTTTVQARPGSTGPLWQRAGQMPAKPGRKTTQEIISGYRATAVLDTPMRKLEVLESQNGEIIVRDTEYMPNRTTADVGLLHLEYHEAHFLARVLLDLEPPAEPANGSNGKAHA
jgi:hypothetical protein